MSTSPENRDNLEQSEQPINRPEAFNPRRNVANLLRIGGTIFGGAVGFGIFVGVLRMEYSWFTYPVVIGSASFGWFVGDTLARKLFPNTHG